MSSTDTKKSRVLKRAKLAHYCLDRGMPAYITLRIFPYVGAEPDRGFTEEELEERAEKITSILEKYEDPEEAIAEIDREMHF